MRQESHLVERWKHQLTQMAELDVHNPVTLVELSEEECWDIVGGAATSTCHCCVNTCGECCGAPSTCTCSCSG
jgi:hypothetical protein